MKRFLFLLLAICTLGLIAGCAQSTPSSESPQTTLPCQFKSAALEDYTIVYSAGNPHYAELANGLADHILEKYDQFLPVAQDADTPPAAYEIIIGDTNRSEAQGSIMEYSVTVEDGKLQIHAGGAFSAQQAIDYLCEQVFNGQEFTLDPGQYYQTSFLTDLQEITQGTTARIMSANVLADAFADSSYEKASYRAEIFAGMLLRYTPDVIGLQETDENWNTVLDGYLEKLESMHGISYARHLATFEDKVNYTSLLYRKDKFQPDDSGVNVFNWWNDASFHHNYHMRNISWAQFSSVSNPEETFIVANTHWSYRTEHANGNTHLAGSNTPIEANELREQCKNETNTFLSSLRQDYPQCPIILTGDFNTSLPFFTESGWTPTGFNIISQEAQETGKSISMVPDSDHFDHLFGTGSYHINLFGFFRDGNQHPLLTDHPFVYADFTF